MWLTQVGLWDFHLFSIEKLLPEKLSTWNTVGGVRTEQFFAFTYFLYFLRVKLLLNAKLG